MTTPGPVVERTGPRLPYRPIRRAAVRRAGPRRTIQTKQSDVDPAIRAFRPGASLDLSFIIYNARGALPDVRTSNLQVRLFRGGRLTSIGPTVPFSPAAEQDRKRLGAEMRFKIDDQLEPGDYLLQVVCAEKPHKANAAIATQ